MVVEHQIAWRNHPQIPFFLLIPRKNDLLLPCQDFNLYSSILYRNVCEIFIHREELLALKYFGYVKVN